MIIKDKKLKELMSESRQEELLQVLVENQKAQDQIIQTVLKTIESSLKSLEKLANKMKQGDPKDFLKYQGELSDAIKALTAASTTNEDYLESLVHKLSSSIDMSEVVQSINNLKQSVDEKPSKEWNFTIMRDEYGRMKTINAITK